MKRRSPPLAPPLARGRGSVLAIAAGLAFLCLLAAPAQARIVIGLSLPLSGNAAVLGEQFLEGARLAVEELAAQGEIVLYPADDACDGELAELAAADLKASGAGIVTGFLCNDAVRASARAFAGEGVPLLIAGARSDQTMRDAKREGWNLFRLSQGDEAQADAAAELLLERWRGIPWAIIDDGTVYGRTLADALRARMEEAGQPPQYADNFRPAQSTQAGLIRRLQRAGVSAAFIAAGAEDVAVIWSDVKDFQARFEVAGGEALELLPFVEGAARVPDGLLAVMEPAPSAVATAKGLGARLVAAGIEPEPYVFLGYAAIELALTALRATPGDTAQALRQTEFRTVLGTVDFNEDGINTVGRHGLYEWRDGRFVLLRGAD